MPEVPNSHELAHLGFSNLFICIYSENKIVEDRFTQIVFIFLPICLIIMLKMLIEMVLLNTQNKCYV